ncbi:MAG: DMT family transporter, partial [Rhodoferax sp.]|nr:DMT family transporter [Rhodoferax sp.]
MKPRDTATYLYLALAWGLSFLVLLRVVRAFGWAGAVSLRSLLAGGVLLLAARLAGRRLDFSAGWRPFAAMGATTVAAQLAGLSLATPRIGTAMMAIMAATIPLFSMLLSQWWGLERITPRRLGGLLLGALGIVLLVGFPQVPYTLDFALGMVAALVTAISAAWGSNYARRRLQRVDAWSITAGSFLWGGLFTLPLLLQQPLPGTPDAGDWLHLLTLAVVMSALA